MGGRAIRKASGWCGLVICSVLLATSPAWADETTAEGEGPAAAPPAAPEPELAPARPSGPHTAGAIQLGLGFRYGALLSEGDLNPWGTGLGLDVGYTLPQAVYLGASFEYFFGGSTELGLGITAKSNIWQLTGEGGYDVGLGEHFVIRPKVGFGIAGAKTSLEGCSGGVECNSQSDTKALIAPGVRLMLFTEKISVAFDFRYAHVFSDPAAKALIFAAGIGF